MSPEQVLPTLLIVIDIGAAAVYGCQGIENWRNVVYWLSAAALTYVVTW